MQHTETTSPDPGYLDFDPAPGRSVYLSLLLPGTRLMVQTRNSLYRIVVEDGPSGRVSISGGRVFPEASQAELIGATEGDDVVKPGWIVEGLRLELRTDRGPVSTSTVESVSL